MFLKLLPLILQIVGWILSRSNASNSTKEAYHKFLESIIADESAPARLRKSVMSQRERILKAWENENVNETTIPK